MQASDLQHILVVDDQRHVRLLLGKFLSSRYPAANITFYDPIEQGRPTESFNWDEYDLVILDINLGPGENGLDWLAEARSHGHSPATLVLTGEGDEETAVRAFDVGALGYLSKLKLTKRRLSEAIDKALAKSDSASRRNSTTQIRSSIFNKSRFYNRLSRSVEGLPDGLYAALFLVAIDDFSAVLSRVGLLESDRIAADVADSICMALTGQSETPNVTRIGDGIVAALVVGFPTVTECHASADAIIASVEALGARDTASAITVSIGGVCVPAGRKVDCEDWLRQADVACRMAGKESGNSFHLDVAGGAMGEPADALRLFNVTEAIKTNRLQCRFQPLAVMSERAGSTEAQYYQLRVQIVAPKGEVHTPPAVVDSSELMRMLDRWVLREALATIHTHLTRAQDETSNQLSVLLSQPSLYDPSLPGWLQGLVQHLGSRALSEALVIELRARDVMADPEAAAAAIAVMREQLGVSFALTDLSLPDLLGKCVRAVKFDYVRLLASAMPDTTNAAGSQFESDVEVAHQSGAMVVVEKVESAAQLSLAVRFGVDFAQGFFLREAQDEIVDDALVDRFIVG